MKKKEGQTLSYPEIRILLIAKGVVKPRLDKDVETAKCPSCERNFERLKGRHWDTYCGNRH